MKIYANQLATNLNQGLSSCYLIFGDEPFQIDEARQLIKQHARKQGIEEFIRLADDDTFDWPDLPQHCQAMSLFSSSKLVELELTTNKIGKAGSDVLKALAPELSKDAILVLFGAKLEAAQTKSAWFKALNDIGVYIPVYEIEGPHLSRWLQNQLQQRSLILDADAQAFLLTYTAGNLLACAQELDKLKLAFPNEPHLSVHAIEKYVSNQSRFTVFQLSDALWQGNIDHCMTILARLQIEEFEPNIILWAMQKDLLMMQQLVDALQNNQPPKDVFDKFRIWKNKQPLYLNAAKRMDPSLLTQALIQLSELDQALKFYSVNCPYTLFAHICCLLGGYQQLSDFKMPFNIEIAN